MANRGGYYWNVDLRIFAKFLQVRGLSVRKLSKTSGIGEATLHRIFEEGRVSLRTVSTLARTLDASPVAMFGPDSSDDLKELRDILRFVED